MHITQEERDLAKAIVRMYPTPPKTRKEVIKNYKIARSVLMRCKVPWKYHTTVALLDVFIHILEYPSHDFMFFIRELWRNSEEWKL